MIVDVAAVEHPGTRSTALGADTSSTLCLGDDYLRDEASHMYALLIEYARVSTNEQDLTARRVALERLGVDPAHAVR